MTWTQYRLPLALALSLLLHLVPFIELPFEQTPKSAAPPPLKAELRMVPKIAGTQFAGTRSAHPARAAAASPGGKSHAAGQKNHDRAHRQKKLARRNPPAIQKTTRASGVLPR
jgi:hypothetical protein